jgi:hypothetical protein
MGGIEKEMRDAQCRTSLDQIRTHLYMKSTLLTYREWHARHQAANTRSREQICDNDRKIKVFQDKYNTARKALIALWVNDDEIEWAKMKEERTKKNKENSLEVRGRSEGYRKLSWIREGPGESTGMHKG